MIRAEFRMSPSQGNGIALMPDWYNTVICKQLGYSKTKTWQLKGIMGLCDGKDAFVVAGTGNGKSTLTLGPIIADHARGQMSIALVVVPTKTLADDQVFTEEEGECLLLTIEYTGSKCKRQRSAGARPSRRQHSFCNNKLPSTKSPLRN